MLFLMSIAYYYKFKYGKSKGFIKLDESKRQSCLRRVTCEFLTKFEKKQFESPLFKEPWILREVIILHEMH